MSHSSKKNEHVNELASSGECGPGCDCGAPARSKKYKVIVSLIVGVAAAAVVAFGFIREAGTENNGEEQAFAATLEQHEESKLWGQSLDSLASLNKLAAAKNAVFVFLPAEDEAQVTVIKEEIDSAVSKIISGGTTTAVYTLEKDAQDYAQLAKRFSVPCVLALVKGRGMGVAEGEITEEKLMKAFVTASRPASSGCCPPGRGSSGCR